MTEKGARVFPESELVQKAKQGLQEGYEGLVDRHLGGVHAFLMHLQAPESVRDDLVQETFVKAFRSIGGFDASKPFGSWLLTIARHVLYDHNSNAKRQLEARSPLGRPAPHHDISQGVIDRLSVRQILTRLSPADRLLIELRVFQGMSFPEIAGLFGEAVGTMRVRLHRILAGLKERINDAEERENRNEQA